MDMLAVIRQGAQCAQRPRPRHLPCPFCGAAPPLAAEIAGRFVVACENEECAANPQVGGASLTLAWEGWDKRAPA